jgi:hypothetical protein
MKQTMKTLVGSRWAWMMLCVVMAWNAVTVSAAPPAPPSDIQVKDYPLDDGTAVKVIFKRSPDDTGAEESNFTGYSIRTSSEVNGFFKEALEVKKAADATEAAEVVDARVTGLKEGEPVFVRVYAVGADDETSTPIQTTESITPVMAWFDFHQIRLLILVIVICSAVILFIELARRGYPMTVRKVAGLEAIDEAVGRATEMGKKNLFIPGVQDINDIQTVAGLNILARISRTVADFDSEIEVPTCRSLVMTAASETIEGAFLAAGRPDAFDPKSIYYVTDEQFGYVAYVTGWMVREKPAACFYFGAFFAESLILAETGNSVGAIQIAGTAQPSQLPFFVAACDYTLIGEEMFAASAYLSGSPEELGSLKGQDMGKVVAAACILVGCLLAFFSPDLMKLIFEETAL